MADEKNTPAKTGAGAAESLGFFALIAGILIVLNVLAYNFNLGRLDTTEQGTWSLSEASRQTVANLTDEMEIIGYFSEDLPAQFASTESYVRDILGEYAAAAGGNLKIRFVNPNEDAEKQEAADAGVPLAAFPDISNDRQGVVQGFAGIAFRYLGETEAIPTVESVEGLEYRITMKIKEMAGEKTVVGVVSGHGSPTLAEGLGFLQNALPAIYELREVDLSAAVPEDIEALLIISPKEPFTEPELQKLNDHVIAGRSLGIFGGGAHVDLAGQTGPSVGTDDLGLGQLIGGWGAQLNGDMVMDCFAGCGRVPVQTQTPFGTMRVPAPYPPMPVVAFDESVQDHPAVFRLRNAQMPFTSSIELTSAPEGVEVRTLIQSTEQSWRETTTIDVTPRQQWNQRAEGPFSLMVALEGALPSAFGEGSAEGARVLVSGTGDHFMWRPEFQPQLPPGQQLNEQQYAAILGLALNNIDWLAAESELVALRAKTVDDPQIAIPEILAAEQQFEAAQEQAEEAIENQDQGELNEAESQAQAAVDAYKEAEEAFDRRKLNFKLFNMLGIPFAFALFGAIRWRMRNTRRKNLSL
ncbi:MAG: GldG family protein [Myxococcota bacterium]